MMKRKLMVAAALLFQISNVLALSSSDITVSRVTAPRFTLDHNKPCEEGPSASYIGIEVTNVSGSTLKDVTVTLSSLSSSSTRVENLSSSDLLIGSMANGQAKTAYFYIKYPCSNSTNVDFTFVVSDNRSGTVNYNTSVYTYNMISANAGGKVEARSTSASTTLGGLVMDTITFSFGNIQVSDEIEFQPAGDSLFNPKGLVLLNCKVIASDIPVNVPVGTEDRMYYISTKKYNGTGHEVRVVFYFVNKLTGTSTDLSPFASLTSGNNLKYTADFGTGIAQTTVSAASNTSPFTVQRSIDKPMADVGDTVVFTVDIINTSSETLMFDKIVESLDTGYAFVAIEPESELTSSEMTAEPTATDQYDVEFVGGVEESTYPYQSYTVESGDTATLVYSATAPLQSSQEVDVTQTTVMVGTVEGGQDVSESCAGCTALPVRLIEFLASEQESSVALTWVTATETNSSHFVLSRLNNVGEYVGIAHIPSAGYSLSVQNYSWLDQDAGTAHTDILQYRLDQVDMDGTTKMYYTQLKRSKEVVGSFVISPNPTEGKVTIETTEWTRDVMQVEVYSMQGKQLLARTLDIDSPCTLSLEGLPQGLYILRLYDGVRYYDTKIQKN